MDLPFPLEAGRDSHERSRLTPPAKETVTTGCDSVGDHRGGRTERALMITPDCDRSSAPNGAYPALVRIAKQPSRRLPRSLVGT